MEGMQKKQLFVKTSAFASEYGLSKRILKACRDKRLIPFLKLNSRTFYYEPERVIEALRRLEVSPGGAKGQGFLKPKRKECK